MGGYLSFTILCMKLDEFWFLVFLKYPCYICRWYARTSEYDETVPAGSRWQGRKQHV